MHHAAMANKKDMMFALARLGCDWRSRADGIDGATASFVLCGQHGKTTRQQVRCLPSQQERHSWATTRSGLGCGIHPSKSMRQPVHQHRVARECNLIRLCRLQAYQRQEPRPWTGLGGRSADCWCLAAGLEVVGLLQTSKSSMRARVIPQLAVTGWIPKCTVCASECCRDCLRALYV